jgi:hypothetical protein
MSIVLALYRYLNDNKLNPLSCILDFHFLFSVCMQKTFIIHFTWDEYLHTLP